MSANDKKKLPAKNAVSKLGHDPLAWLDEAEKNTVDTNISPQTGMEIKIQKNITPDISTLNLPVYFGIAQSSDVCSEMRQLMDSGCKTIEIAGGEVESFDAAAVQLMMAFHNQAVAAGVEIKWSGCSQKISEVKNLMGVNF